MYIYIQCGRGCECKKYTCVSFTERVYLRITADLVVTYREEDPLRRSHCRVAGSLGGENRRCGVCKPKIYTFFHLFVDDERMEGKGGVKLTE